jgi:hypothetical protein
MGGLFARAAATELFTNPEEHFPAPHAFITLATPHLGIYGLCGRAIAWFAGMLGQGVRELLLEDATLLGLSNTGRIALGRFSYRVAYAPLQDDGVVAFESAALSLQQRPSCLVNTPLLLPAVTVEWAPDAKQHTLCAWLPGEDAKAVMVSQIREALVSSGTPWIVLGVNLTHAQLATLYPTRKGSRKDRNTNSFTVAEDVLTHVLCASVNE